MTHDPFNHCAHCFGPCETLDAAGDSATLRCRRCHRCTLSICLPAIKMAIPLTLFHLVRGEGVCERPLDDHRLATDLVKCLLNNLPFTREMIEAVGIDTIEHVTALNNAVRYGVTAYDLDRVLGDGPAITWLVSSMPYQSDRHLRFVASFEDFVEKDCVVPVRWRDQE